MSLFEQLGSALLKGVMNEVNARGGLGGVLGEVLQKTNLNSVDGVLGKLREAGLDKQVDSWLSKGKNIPVSAEQVKEALGNKAVQDIVRQLGLPVDQTLDVLAKYLPQAIDEMSPNGKLEAPKKK